ncbi:hypothetical protein J2847_004082 [Azospirillum agricola]|uniref:hypothetical protein n=1 Tax=Azospirillum agricola TaxID=1720247 RepID=UPI001AE11370|nr:hypothetical protein [Azospirillum agricola]MBP2230773.1 hypothetical protein [Azospirillum agricola]
MTRRPSSREIAQTRRVVERHRFDHLRPATEPADGDDIPSLPALGLALVRMDAEAHRAGC